MTWKLYLLVILVVISTAMLGFGCAKNARAAKLRHWEAMKENRYFEIWALYVFCRKLGIDAEIMPLFDGWKLSFPDGSDFVQHEFSYGSGEGCVEPAIGCELDYSEVTLWRARALVTAHRERLAGKEVPADNPSVTFGDSSLYTREPWADVGAVKQVPLGCIGPYASTTDGADVGGGVPDAPLQCADCRYFEACDPSGEGECKAPEPAVYVWYGRVACENFQRKEVSP